MQSIKRPSLLEIWGPLFMSTAATSNLMYRLTETPDGTLIKFTHTVVGPFPEEHRSPLATGWNALHARVRKALKPRQLARTSDRCGARSWSGLSWSGGSESV